MDAREQRIAPVLEQRLVGHGSRRHDAHDLAFHRSLGLARIAALFADGDRFAALDESYEIAVDARGGHARHRDRRARGRATLGQRDVEQLRRATRIVIEHFIEIAHAVEQQHVGMLCLDAQVLLHHGGVLRRRIDRGVGGGKRRFRFVGA